MYSSYPDNAKERRRRRRDARSRLQAIASFLIRSERRGLRISPLAQYFLENECLEVFKDYDGPPDTFQFATMLRETAVRMFRQGRYKEANQRYRMASLFNPFDATLLSNRATCIYNLRRYRRCIEICELCFSAFPNLYYEENTGLYFQVLILLANAHLKLRNFNEALGVYNTLVCIKDKLSSQRDTRVSVTEAVNKLRRFEIDLELAKNDSSSHNENPELNHGKPVRPVHFPYQEERGRFLHPHTPSSYLREINTGIDDYDLNSEEDGDPTLVVNVEHLCHHVYYMGMGPCAHDDDDLIWQIDSDSCSDDDDEQSEENFYFGDDASLYGNLIENEYSKVDCTCGRNHGQGPDLVAREELPSDDDEILPPLQERDPACDEYEFVTVCPFKQEDFSGTQQRMSFCSSLPSQVKTGAKANRFSRAESSHERTSEETKLPARKLKKLLVMDEAIDALRSVQFSSDCIRCPGEKENEKGTEYRKLVAELTSFVSKNKWTMKQSKQTSGSACDSDLDEPVAELDFSLIPQLEDMDLLGKATEVLPSGNDTFLSRCTAQIFGSSFHSTGTLDFTRYFGPHSRLQSQGGKKKSKACDRNCTPCFARRMWKLRFKSHKVADAQEFFVNVHNDDRIDNKNFLSLSDWNPSGYYGSGYELASEHGILLHGVAFLILLQNEVCWQKNEVGFVKSIQKPFCTALLKNMKTGTDLLAISTLLDMLLETLHVIHCIKYQEWKRIPRSPQFIRTPQLVAGMASSSPDLSSLGAKDKVARLMSQNGTAVENFSRWALAGHLDKEEEWVYHTLSRNVREVILHFARRVLNKSPIPLPSILNSVPGEVTEVGHLEHVLYRQRCRELEKKSSSRKSMDLERGDLMLTRSIEAFPMKLRLYFKRAQVRYQMNKWDACIRDLSQLQSLAGKQKEPSNNQTSEKQKSLLYQALLLEGDAHRERAQEPNSAQKSHIIASIDLYRRALNMWSRKKKNRGKLLQKVREQEHLLASLENNKHGKWSREPSPKVMSQRTQKATVSQQVVTPQIDSASSSEEDEGAIVPGSRYGALLKDISKTPSASRRGKEMSQAPKSRASIRSIDTGPQRSGRNGTRSNNGPSPEMLVSEVRRILSLFGGEARSTDIIDNLDLSQWNIQDPANYVTTTFGTLNSLCSEFGAGLEVRAGSQSDPVLALTNDGEFTQVSRRRPPSMSSDGRRNTRTMRRRPVSRNRDSRRRSSTIQPHSGRKPEARTSETLDYAKIIEDLLKGENDSKTRSRDSLKSSSERDKECCICLDNPSDSLTIPCRHPFCETCILDYLARENSDKICPVCRSAITNVASMTVHQDRP